PTLGRYPSLLAVPLKQDERTIGVLCVESKRRNLFSQDQATFLLNLAGHMVISLANARLMEERATQVLVLGKLREMSLRLAGMRDRDEVARVIIETGLEILAAQHGKIDHYEGQQGRLIHLGSYHQETAETDSPQAKAGLDPKIIENVLTSGNVRVVRQPEAEQTVMLIPMIRGRRMRMLLLLTFPIEQQLSTRHLEMAELLGNEAASHMESTLLYEQIQANSNRMRAILESTYDGIILLDASGKIMDYNNAAETMLDTSLAAYAGEAFDTVPLNITEVGQPDLAHEMLPRNRTTGGITRTQLELHHADGEVLYMERTELPVEDAQNRINGQLLVLRDITEERELAKYRDEIIFMLVHDLRGPLGSVIAGLNFAEELINDPDQLDYLPTVLQLAHRSSNRLMNLINTLLDVEREQMSMITESWNIADLVRSAYDELVSSAQEVNVTMSLHIAPGLPTIDIDGEKIERVLINLLDNALDYSVAQIIVRATWTADEQAIRISVNDDGPGIPAEQRSNIFGKFTQVGSQTERRNKHSGIGLTYCRRAIEAHGGDIWVADPSEVGCELPGACFVFTLPIDRQAALGARA
ncbi:MAG: ATP-binding protein, partial [Chloroflexota bacterium]